MCPRDNAQRGDTYIHHTALIVNKTTTNFIEHQEVHVCTLQPELETQAMFSPLREGKVAVMPPLPTQKPSQKYQISTHTLLRVFKMQVTVESQ